MSSGCHGSVPAEDTGLLTPSTGGCGSVRVAILCGLEPVGSLESLSPLGCQAGLGAARTHPSTSAHTHTHPAHTHVHTQVRAHTHPCTCIHTPRAHTCTHAHAHTPTPMHTHPYTCTYTTRTHHVHTHAHMPTRIHPRPRTHTTYTHAHTPRTHAHAHLSPCTRAWLQLPLGSSCSE